MSNYVDIEGLMGVTVTGRSRRSSSDVTGEVVGGYLCEGRGDMMHLVLLVVTEGNELDEISFDRSYRIVVIDANDDN